MTAPLVPGGAAYPPSCTFDAALCPAMTGVHASCRSAGMAVVTRDGVQAYALSDAAVARGEGLATVRDNATEPVDVAHRVGDVLVTVRGVRSTCIALTYEVARRANRVGSGFASVEELAVEVPGRPALRLVNLFASASVRVDGAGPPHHTSHTTCALTNAPFFFGTPCLPVGRAVSDPATGVEVILVNGPSRHSLPGPQDPGMHARSVAGFYLLVRTPSAEAHIYLAQVAVAAEEVRR